MVTVSRLKINVFWKQSYDVIISVHNVTNMTQHFYERSYHNLKFIKISEQFLKSFRKTTFFEGWSSFKFNNLELALGTALSFSTIVTKVLKLNIRKFGWLITSFLEVAGEKLLQGAFLGPPSWIGLMYSGLKMKIPELYHWHHLISAS